jgi:hypothetical protein
MQRSLSMRRLAVVTAVMFLVVLAFLAGRVRAGADPAQVGARPAPSSSSSSMPGYGAPGDIGPSGDPSAGTAGAPGDGSVVPDGDPPVTHAS